VDLKESLRDECVRQLKGRKEREQVKRRKAKAKETGEESSNTYSRQQNRSNVFMSCKDVFISPRIKFRKM